MFFDYKIYSDGKVFSLKSNKYLKHDITKCGYHQVTLYVNGNKIRKKVHRLVAYLFCNPPENYLQLTVDHIDGNKENNNYKNLELVTISENNRRARINGLNNISLSNKKRWENDTFRKQTSEKISNGRKLNGSSKGKKNPMFRYEIKDVDGNEYDITTLSERLNSSYSLAYKLVRQYCETGTLDVRLKKLNLIINDIKK
jgi:DNA endonuclease I-hmuI